MNQKTIGVLFVAFALVLLVILGFVKASFETQAVYLCKAVENDPTQTMDQCPAHTSNVPTLLMVAFVVAGLILASGGYLYLASPSQKTQSDTDTKPNTMDLWDLSETEKQVYYLIKEQNGLMYQSDLVKKTDLTKVQVSRLLDKLEGQGLLERRRKGMANVVVLR